MGIDLNSEFRVCSGLKYVLAQAASNGHTYLPVDKLKELSSGLLDIQPELVDYALVNLVMEKSIFTENLCGVPVSYLASYYYAEMNVCRKLLELVAVEYSDTIKDFGNKLEKVISSKSKDSAEYRDILNSMSLAKSKSVARNFYTLLKVNDTKANFLIDLSI
jgi:hypothetical protein